MSMVDRRARRVVGTLARILATLMIMAMSVVAFGGPAAASDSVPGGKLFAGGFFTQAGGVTANSVAAWNGVDWSALTGANGEGADDQVMAMTMFRGKLVVAGAFLHAGGEVVSGIATWDGTRWEPLVGSSGAIGLAILPLGFASSLAVYNGDLYVGGRFPLAGGVRVNNLARWDGHDWSAVTGPSGFGTENGGTTSAPVWDMTMVDGQLIVAGEFTSAGGVAANSVAAWNGSTWSSVDQPLPGAIILAAESYNGRLVVTRTYSEDNLNVNDVVWRDGGRWSALGGTPAGRLDGNVRDFTLYNGLLIAGGQFTHVGGTTVNHVTAWNGSSWSALSGPAGVGVDGDVFAMTPHQGFLTIGGFFTRAGGQTVSNIARWNGSAWSALPGGGVNSTVFELTST
jgi:hypothetical protein